MKLGEKGIVFDSDLRGLRVGGVEYVAGSDGKLIYDRVVEIRANQVEVQMSSNTSTLIPTIRILGLEYNAYFDLREVVESQNNIAFYWQPSRLAAYYNRFSTDELAYVDRERVIREAVKFLVGSARDLRLKEESLTRLKEQCKLLGFYKGFPVFDNRVGLAKLQSRLGIHVDLREVMISTPMDKYQSDVYELAEELKTKTGMEYSKKKNRAVFVFEPKLMETMDISREQ